MAEVVPNLSLGEGWDRRQFLLAAAAVAAPAAQRRAAPTAPAELGVPSAKWPVSADARERDRRSIYVFVKRNLRYPLFSTFDAPDRSETCARRHVSTNAPQALTARLGRLMSVQPGFGAWIHELHHAAKKDAPSGTALAMELRLRGAGYTAAVPIASTRAGAIPGTHTLGFDAFSETITLTHQARDRAAFARGALLAARWIIGKKGWFSMADVLGLEKE